MSPNPADEKPTNPEPRSLRIFMVHGIYDRGAIFNKMAARLKKRGMKIHNPDFVPSSGWRGLEVHARSLDRLIRKYADKDEKVCLVGFSMGGLVCRYYLQRMEGAAFVEKWITISAPHHGTWTAHLASGRGIKQMRRESEFLSDLARDTERIQHIPFLSLWTPFDLMILPAKSSVVSFGSNKKVPVLAHPLMVRDDRIINSIIEFLEEGSHFRSHEHRDE